MKSIGLRRAKASKKSEAQGESLDPELAKYKTQKRKERRAILIVSTLIVVLIIFFSSVIFVSGPKKTSQLSAYSDRWNDISKFRDYLNRQTDSNNRKLYETSSIISSPTILRNLDNEEDYLYMAIGVEKEFGADEVDAIMDFVWYGGSVIIADDFGYGNSFVETAKDIDESFNIRFAAKPLWDENYATDPRFIKINVNQDESKLDFEGLILLNDPTAMIRDNPAEKWSGRTLVSSSSKGWIDVNGDNKPSPDEPEERMGKKPIIHELTHGDGAIIFVCDPSIFINDMWIRENNSAFADALVRYLVPNTEEDGGGIFKNNNTRHIIFDESLHVQDDVFSNARQTLYEGLVVFTSDTQLKILIGILALLFLGVIIIVIEDPPSLKHRFNIDFYNLHELKSPNISAKDCVRIRYVYLERLRITHGLSVEDFKELSYDELYDLIRDDDLVEFALDWDKKYYGEDLEKLLLKIRDTF
ncbi:DUF4350 domain-containing protein [[Eubacterium] cellulosolvens]